MELIKEREQAVFEESKKASLMRVGVIGCGYWGPNLIRNFITNPESTVVAVADLRQERLDFIRTLYPQIQTIHDYHELFNMGLDAVVVATPPATHFRIANEVLDHNLHTFIEKPITLNSGDAKKLIAKAAAKDRVLMVGHAFEYNVAVETLKDMIDRGDLGDIHYIDSARLNLGLFQHGLNVLWDLAPHDISILCYILGKEPVSVSAKGARCISPNIFDVVYMNLHFPDNILAHIHVSWLDPYKVRRVTVVGSKKMVVYNDVAANKIKIVDKGVGLVHPQTDVQDFADYQYSYRNGDILTPYIQFVEPLRKETQHFLDCIKNHTEPLSGGEDGLRIVTILEAAQRSLDNNSREEAILIS